MSTRFKFKQVVVVPLAVEVRGTNKREFNRALTRLFEQGRTGCVGLSDVMYGDHCGFDQPAFRIIGIRRARDIKKRYRK